MEFNQLKYIVEVVEMGSISKAANALFLSQPNLSSQIALLEKEIGRQLFIRGNRGVTLTKEGIEVYNYAKQVVSQFELTEQKLLNHISDHKIKIASCGCEIIEPAFLEICKNFNTSNYEFELEYCSIEKCMDKLATQEVDLAIIPYTVLQYKKLDQFLVNKNLCMENLFTGELKVHISDKWAISRKERIDLKDLKGLIHVKKHMLFSGLFSLDYEMRHMGIGLDTVSIVTHQIKTYEATLSRFPSFGITPEWHCNLEVNPTLKRVPFNLGKIDVNIAMLKRQNEVLREEVIYFLEQLERYKR